MYKLIMNEKVFYIIIDFSSLLKLLAVSIYW